MEIGVELPNIGRLDCVARARGGGPRVRMCASGKMSECLIAIVPSLHMVFIFIRYTFCVLLYHYQRVIKVFKFMRRLTQASAYRGH